MFKFIKNLFSDVNKFREWSLVPAELLDAYRIIPRMILTVYGYFCWDIIQWFQCLQTPTTEQTVLVTAVVGVAGLVFSTYSNSGREWKDGFKPWPSRVKELRDAINKSMLIEDKEEKKD